jgi:hypothetical protein
VAAEAAAQEQVLAVGGLQRLAQGGGLRAVTAPGLGELGGEGADDVAGLVDVGSPTSAPLRA